MDNLDNLTIGVKFDVKSFASSAQQIESIVNKLTNKLYEQFSTTFDLISDGFKELSKDFKSINNDAKELAKSVNSISNKKVSIQLDKKKFTQSMNEINNLTSQTVGNISKSFNKLSNSINNVPKLSKDAVKDNIKVINALNTKTNKINIKINTKEVKQGNEEIEQNSAKTVKNINDMFSRLFTGLGIGFSLRATTNFLMGMNKLGSQLQFIGSVSNVNTQKLQQYRQAINAMGGSAEEVTGQIQSLYSSLTEAGISGNPELAKWLGGLGIATRDANNNLRDTADIIGDILDKVNALKKDQRLPALNKFGLQGLLPLANLSNAQRREKLESFKSTSLSDKQIEQNRVEQEKWTEVFQKWQKIGADINTQILPAVDHLADVIQSLLGIIEGDFSPAKDYVKKYLSYKELTKEEKDKIYSESKNNIYDKRGNYINNKSNNVANTSQQPVIIPKFNPNEDVPPIMFNNIPITPSASINHNHRIGTQHNNNNVSMNIQNLNLPEATNPQEFAQSITKMSQTGWGFSGSRLA